MSGIAGIVSRQGQPALSEVGLRAMLGAMAHRARDGSAVLRTEEAGLGLAWSDTGAHPARPAAVERRGRSFVVADCRLDARDELATKLGMARQVSSDPALILCAYERWGEDCIDHLEGDFAFAIWDAGRRLLFCARDRFGVKPFHYHCDGRRFVFASEIRPILAVGVSRRIDESHVAGFLAGLPDDFSATPYAEVLRLPPHHCLTVARDRIALRSYWELEPKARDPRRDAPEEFRELFTRSVAARLEGTPAVGAMLSGGLDSSSICCTARELREGEAAVPTFSLTFEPGSAMDERRHIDAVLSLGGFEGNLLPVGDYAPFRRLADVVSEQQGPFLAPGLTLTRRLFDAARDRGLRVLLDGHGGDEVVSHGYGRLHQLASERRLIALWRECRGASAVFGTETSDLFVQLLLSHSAGARARRLVARGRRLVRGAPRAEEGARDWRDLVDPELSRRTSLVDRYRKSGIRPNGAVVDETLSHRWNLASGLVPHGLEVLDRAAAHAGIEPRYPFWDRALVEFCLSLPPEQKLNGGWSRHVFRRAMEGILPEEVQWRRDKIDFKQSLAVGMVRHHRPMIDAALGRDADRISGFVKVPNVRAAFYRMAGDPVSVGMEDLQHVWRAVVLSTWLGQIEEGRIAA